MFVFGICFESRGSGRSTRLDIAKLEPTPGFPSSFAVGQMILGLVHCVRHPCEQKTHNFLHCAGNPCAPHRKTKDAHHFLGPDLEAVSVCRANLSGLCRVQCWVSHKASGPKHRMLGPGKYRSIAVQPALEEFSGLQPTPGPKSWKVVPQLPTSQPELQSLNRTLRQLFPGEECRP